MYMHTYLMAILFATYGKFLLRHYFIGTLMSALFCPSLFCYGAMVRVLPEDDGLIQEKFEGFASRSMTVSLYSFTIYILCIMIRPVVWPHLYSMGITVYFALCCC